MKGPNCSFMAVSSPTGHDTKQRAHHGHGRLVGMMAQNQERGSLSGMMASQTPPSTLCMWVPCQSLKSPRSWAPAAAGAHSLYTVALPLRVRPK